MTQQFFPILRVLIADDQPSIRLALQEQLQSFSDIEIVGIAENGQQVIEQVEACQPDVLLLDLEMPILDGLGAAKAIKAQFPHIKILVLTAQDDPATLLPVLRVGAHGYLLKGTPAEDLANAIRSVQKGHFQIGPGILEPTLKVGMEKSISPALGSGDTLVLAPPDTHLANATVRTSELVKANVNAKGGALAKVGRSSTLVFESPILLKRSPLWSRLIIWTIVLCAGGAVSAAALAHYEEAVFASGQLEPLGAVKEVQSPVTGVVKTLYVKDGQTVKKGDLLLQLDPKGQRSEAASLQQVKQKLMDETAFYQQQLELPTNQAYTLPSWGAIAPQEMLSLANSRRALVEETQLFYSQSQGGTSSKMLTAQQQLRLQVGLKEEASRASVTQSAASQLEQQLQQTAIEQASAQTTLETQQTVLSNITALADAGGIAKLEQIKQAEEVQRANAAVNRLKKEQQRLRFAISQAQDQYQNTVSLSQRDILDKIAVNEKRLAEIDSQFAKAVVENQKQIVELDNRIAQAQFTMQDQSVRSPADGVIFDMKAKSAGFVTKASEPILKLVPSDSLVAKVFISNKDIGFIHSGMQVDVRVDSFPFSEYGDIKGTLVSVGSDALPPTEVRPFYSFPAKVVLESQSLKTQGKILSLQSGMSISINIKTRSRNVMSLFTEQFTNQVEGVKHLR